MNAHVTITQHAAERIEERLGAELGDAAREVVEDFVLDAVWNHRFRRRAPRWLPTRALVRGDSVRYAVGRVDRLRFVCVVALDRGRDPILVTVITERSERALAPVPTLAGGRMIGTPRIGALPVAFQEVAA